MSLFRQRREHLEKGELGQRDVINKLEYSKCEVYAAYCGMKSHFGRKSVSHYTIELHPTMRLELHTNKSADSFLSPLSFGDDDEESLSVMFFERSFSKVINLDTGKELENYRDYFEILKFFDNKKDADLYFLREFKDFYNHNGFGKTIKYFRKTYKDMVVSDPDLVMKIIGRT